MRSLRATAAPRALPFVCESPQSAARAAIARSPRATRRGIPGGIRPSVSPDAKRGLRGTTTLAGIDSRAIALTNAHLRGTARHYSYSRRAIETLAPKDFEHLIDRVRCARDQQAARRLRIGEQRSDELAMVRRHRHLRAVPVKIAPR